MAKRPYHFEVTTEEFVEFVSQLDTPLPSNFKLERLAQRPSVFGPEHDHLIDEME